jgi:hypothetical protein
MKIEGFDDDSATLNFFSLDVMKFVSKDRLLHPGNYGTGSCSSSWNGYQVRSSVTCLISRRGSIIGFRSERREEGSVGMYK